MFFYEESREDKFFRIFPFVILGVIALFVISLLAIAITGHYELLKVRKIVNSNIRPASEASIAGKIVAQGKVIKIAKRTMPSVVEIETKAKKTIETQDKQIETIGGTGSGFVIRHSGYIVTNEHVVDGADEVIVDLNHKKYEATIIGADRGEDVAVIKIKAKNLPVLTVSPLRDIKIGQLAVAIGSPREMKNSVTAGVISGLNRTIVITIYEGLSKSYSGLIQTDAAINPGNSGGPLIDSSGRVMGMNSFIWANNELSFNGIAFAIPAEKVVKITNQIIEKDNLRKNTKSKSKK